MKPVFKIRTASFDADSITNTIQRALASAGLETAAGPMHEVTGIIRRALGAGRLADAAEKSDGDPVTGASARAISAGDGESPIPESQPLIRAGGHGRGRFELHEFCNDAGSRAYKVYVPRVTPDAPRALIVMLHGCTQSADDFAAGTQMNRLADQHGFVVLYPEQALHANASKCWNWFRPQDQLRGAGEPSLIAGMAREAAQRQGVDPRRIFIAGLSAGAAMALVLGETYPEVFAGVGVHSGLPYGSAHDVPSALAVMKGGRSGIPGLKNPPAGPLGPRTKATQAVPVIVFHGDRDHTVQQSNGSQIVLQAEAAHGSQTGAASMRVTHHAGVAPGGRRFSRAVHADSGGQIRIENWTLHGAGHAWSGGHASGSHTDATGPDASAEMVRFFMALPTPSA